MNELNQVQGDPTFVLTGAVSSPLELATVELSALFINASAYPSENSFVFFGTLYAELNWIESPTTTVFNFIINDGKHLEYVNSVIINWVYPLRLLVIAKIHDLIKARYTSANSDAYPISVSVNSNLVYCFYDCTLYHPSVFNVKTILTQTYLSFKRYRRYS